MNVKLIRDCTRYAIIALFIALIYSYKNAVWVNEQYAAYFKRGDTSTPIYMIDRIISLSDGEIDDLKRSALNTGKHLFDGSAYVAVLNDAVNGLI